jgi:hypothetical protein
LPIRACIEVPIRLPSSMPLQAALAAPLAITTQPASSMANTGSGWEASRASR